MVSFFTDVDSQQAKLKTQRAPLLAVGQASYRIRYLEQIA